MPQRKRGQGQGAEGESATLKEKGGKGKATIEKKTKSPEKQTDFKKKKELDAVIPAGTREGGRARKREGLRS